MLVRKSAAPFLFFLGFAASGALMAQSPSVLYTWNTPGNVQGWSKNFGANTVTLTANTPGELTVTETGTAGEDVALSDDFNSIFEGQPGGAGGVDLTGLSTLEFDMGHNGPGPVNVQFFAQASTGSNYVALGPDQAIAPGLATYGVPMAALSPAQIAYIRTIGINIRDHLAEGNLVWTLGEVRSVGAALSLRNYATHDAGSSDAGLQGAIVNFDNAAVAGNDGGQNQTGLSQNLSSSPAGNTGSLRWTDLAAGNGGAVTWANGTVFNGNTFNERPTDMSNYRSIVVRMAATNTGGGNVPSVDVQYFLQTGNFTFYAAGADQTLPADGQYHELCFAIEDLPNLNFVVQHGVNLRAHAGGDLIIDVDNLQTRGSACRPPLAAPSLNMAGWLILSLGLLLGGSFLVRRRTAPAR